MSLYVVHGRYVDGGMYEYIEPCTNPGDRVSRYPKFHEPSEDTARGLLYSFGVGMARDSIVLRDTFHSVTVGTTWVFEAA